MNILKSILAVLLGGWLFYQLRIPGGLLIGAMVGAIVLNLSGTSFERSPDWMTTAAFIVIGWKLGEEVTRETLKTLRTSLVPIAIIVTTLLVAAGLVTLLLNRAAGLDTSTAFLASSPGALTQMAALSVETGADPALVVTAHVVRVVSIVFLAPIIMKWLH